MSIINPHHLPLYCRRGSMSLRARKREEGVAVENRYQMTAVRTNGARFPISATVARVELTDGPATIGFFQDDPEN